MAFYIPAPLFGHGPVPEGGMDYICTRTVWMWTLVRDVGGSAATNRGNPGAEMTPITPRLSSDGAMGRWTDANGVRPCLELRLGQSMTR